MYHAAQGRFAGLLMATALGFGAVSAAHAETTGHPHMQPVPGPTIQTVSPDGRTTFVQTPESGFPESDPFANPPGTNLLPTIFSNVIDHNGDEIPNTLPSTPDNPYNLHPDPDIFEIDKTSPTDDLDASFDRIRAAAQEGRLDSDAIALALDVLEGNPIPGRMYSGFPVLHYNGPLKVNKVKAIYDDEGRKIGGTVNVHQIWYDTHIESDTALLDTSEVEDVPWTLTYTVDVLNRGHDDFSPFAMYFDIFKNPDGSKKKIPFVGFDQTFFPMEDGTRTVFHIAQPPAKFYKLTYHWGWRKHPPRVQVFEKASNTASNGEITLDLLEWEQRVFGVNPRESREAQLRAISMIGDLAPAKRMWNALRGMEQAYRRSGGEGVLALVDEAERAFFQWQDRTRLPDGVSVDPDSDVTLLYVNNTIYGQATGQVDRVQPDMPKWNTRGTTIKIKLYNGDYYEHGYVNVDFGGLRGWENTYHSTIDIGGAGPWFTFGRAHWWPNAGAGEPIMVPPATISGRNVRVGEHNVHITYNFEPSRRLRFYQFDPLHHDVAVWSVH